VYKIDDESPDKQ